MRTFLFSGLGSLAIILVLWSCVDPYEPDFISTIDVLVVDGTITDLPETQVIKLSRSIADKITGRFGTTIVSGAQVELLIDAGQILSFNIIKTFPVS